MELTFKLRCTMSTSLFVTALLLPVPPAANAQEPQFFQNQRFNNATTAEVNRDIADCKARGNQFIASQGGGQNVVGQGVRGAARGAALGAVAGTITGNTGRGVGAGAAVGGLSSTARAAQERGNANPDFQRAVNACLEDRGYRVVNWR